ncbi:YeeE/YedE family protein [Pseudomonas aeruginosa]|uniref:YeeE/YedE family protein n=1 Tax=Pseudomonas aeruginosa TaxID=287 RepID=UPI00193B9618|nr:YeeE/YedE family protein [Pseudomonas aeruginosa]MBM2625465.1 YeeE/YedE family protein [Pseudomonas aeruginosa]MBM2644207.1 YeeE/YedE family protein [Pseudomonas aeruginosa]MBM2644587.1 YeeE/YedE family protein [Pseudomonas aeruginosa]MBM2683986.1 YeeE/YedE family protein [Pseudomonas aeruginosa]MBM2696509.1 YeeE/YedE family protein [Pseudomonas aeruginosa]
MSVALSAAPERKLAAPLIAFALLVLGGLFLFNAVSARQAILFIVGGALGLTLYHAAFGFTSAWRVFIRERRGAGLRAQMVMLALAVLLFFPALAAGSLFGQPVSGFVSPVGTSVIVGAFIFGIGMQLGGGCASGTLFTVGGGNARMLVTLLFFILGSLIATQHVGWWFALPSLPPISLVAGRPWGITSAFALWGAKIAQGVGLDVGAWAFWQTPANAKALAAPLWEDITSVMDIGIVLGALLAAGLAGRFAPNLDIPRRSLAAAVIGGLLLGYGARLAYGCNIGAYFSGIASGSLHGWLWLVAAFAGNSVGVRVLRPYFFPEERREQGLTGC